MKSNINQKRNYKGKKNSDIVNFPVDFRRELLSPIDNKEVLKMPLSSHKIVFKILNDVSNDQFQEKNKHQKSQLSLFEEDFKTEHNTYARFQFKVTEISENRDYSNIIRGLEFLENYKKGWYKSVNEKGKTIKSYGGLISNSNISEGYITFLISSYWLEKLLKIPSYNQAYFKTPWVLSKNKHILFYLWLLEVPDNGTKVGFQRIQEVFGYNYKNCNSFAKNVLKSIKTKLDRYSNVSFNYSVKSNTINIVPYYTKDVELDLKKETINKQIVTQKLHYWKIRHELSKNDIETLKSIINIDNSAFKIFTKAYKSIVQKSRGNNKVTDYKGGDFITLFQNEIINVYKDSVWYSSSPNGYPQII